MPGLQRTTRRLLHTVNGKQHATEADHEPEQAPGQNDEDDWMRDPDSSDEDVTTTLPQFSDLQNLSAKATKRPDAKRKSESESDGDIFGSRLGSQPKRQKTTAIFRKIEVPTSSQRSHDAKSSQSSRSAACQALRNGRTSPRSRKDLVGIDSSEDELAPPIHTSRVNNTIAVERHERPRKKQDKKYSSQSSQSRQRSQPQFKESKTKVKDTARATVKFKTLDGLEAFSSSLEQAPSSPLLSSGLSSPPSDIEEVLDLTGPAVLRVRCEVCHEMVPQSMREDYEDRFNDGKRLTVTRRQAFCNYHKRHEAQDLWQQRGYPKIDWDETQMAKRMKRQHARLVRILRGEESSPFQEELAIRIAARQDRTVHSAMSSHQSSSTGYYGPRGQKMMLEHISTYLASELREQSTKDTLIGSAGVGGGVSGFVQSVLVPEMAVALVAEDMHCSLSDALVILDESRLLGEVLCDEVREQIVEAELYDTI